MGTSRWSDFYGLAGRQHGVVHVRQAAELGLPGSTLRRRARAEGWGRIHDGVLLLPGIRPTFRSRCLAAQLAGGRGALVGRWSALHLLDLVRTCPTHVDLVVPWARRAPRLDRVRPWRSRTLTDDDRTTVDGIPVTDPTRSLVDIAGVADLGYLRSRTLAAIQRRLTTPQRLEARVGQLETFPGRGRIRRVLDELRCEQPDSGFEHDVREHLRRNGFGDEIHPRPFPFRCPDGVVVHLDVAMPRWWLALECDSVLWHGGQHAFETDRVRWSQIQAGGWRIVWVTDRRFREDPAGIITEIREHIAAADTARHPPVPAT